MLKDKPRFYSIYVAKDPEDPRSSYVFRKGMIFESEEEAKRARDGLTPRAHIIPAQKRSTFSKFPELGIDQVLCAKTSGLEAAIEMTNPANLAAD